MINVFPAELFLCSLSSAGLFKKLLACKPFQKRLERKPFEKRFYRKLQVNI
jgi:hypothetical protein